MHFNAESIFCLLTQSDIKKMFISYSLLIGSPHDVTPGYKTEAKYNKNNSPMSFWRTDSS